MSDAVTNFRTLLSQGDINTGASEQIASLRRRIERVERMEFPSYLSAKNASCRAYRTTNQSIANATWTAIQFDATRFNTGAMWVSGSNTRITFALAGGYVVAGGISFAGAAAGYRYTSIMVNGGTDIVFSRNGNTDANDQHVFISTVYQFNAGDYIQMRAYQDSGAALNAMAYTNYSPELSAALLYPLG